MNVKPLIREILIEQMINGYRINDLDLKIFSYDSKIMKLAVMQNGINLRAAPEIMQRDREIVKLAIMQNGLALKHADFSLQNDLEIVKIAVKQNGLALEFIGRKLKESEFYRDIVKLAIENDSECLESVGKELQDDDELVKFAVERNGDSLEFASERLKNDLEVVKQAVMQNGVSLQYANEDLQKDKEIVKLAVMQNGLALEFAKEKEKEDPEIVKQAVMQNGMSLKYANKKLQKDPEIVKLAVMQNGMSLEFANEDLQKDNEIVKQAVMQNGKALEFAKEKGKEDPEIVKQAVMQDGLALEFANKKLQKDPEIVKLAVIQNGLTLNYADEDLQKDYDIVKQAVMQNGLVLRYASSELRKNIDIIELSVTQNGLSLNYVDRDMKSISKLVKLAVMQNGMSLQFASTELQDDDEIVKLAVSQNGLSFLYASPRLRKSREMVILAMKTANDILKYASKELQNDIILKLQDMKSKTKGTLLENYVYTNNKFEEINAKTLQSLFPKYILDIFDENIKNKYYHSFNQLLLYLMGKNCSDVLDSINELREWNSIEFIPSWSLLNGLPKQYVTNFNKNKWFTIAKEKVFNINEDNKFSLIKLLIINGIFKNDRESIIRYQNLLDIINFIPKTITTSEYKNIDNKYINMINKYYINKSEYKYDSLFSDDLSINYINTLPMQLRELIMEVPISNKIIRKTICEEDYKYLLGRDDIDKEWLKNFYNERENEIYKRNSIEIDLKDKEILKVVFRIINHRHVLTADKIYDIFNDLKLEYNENFYKLIKDNIFELLEMKVEPRIMSSIQSEINKIIKAYAKVGNNKITIQDCINKLAEIEYLGVKEGNHELARLCKMCHANQEVFEKYQEIYEIQKLRKESYIPQIQVDVNTNNIKLHGKMLNLTDPVILVIGEYKFTRCCQGLGGLAESSMIHSATSTYGRIFCVYDEFDNILTQSWIWRDGNTVVFDSIEGSNQYKEKKNPQLEMAVLDTYKEAAKNMIENYSEIENATIGTRSSVVSLSGLERVPLGATPTEPGLYLDSAVQVLVAGNKDINYNTVVKKYRDKREISTIEGTELTEDQFYLIGKMNCGNNKTKMSALDISISKEPLKVVLGEDWYFVYNNDNNCIHIVDIVKGKSRFNDEEDIRQLEIYKSLLLIAKQEVNNKLKPITTNIKDNDIYMNMLKMGLITEISENNKISLLLTDSIEPKILTK